VHGTFVRHTLVVLVLPPLLIAARAPSTMV
jgi:hypothetical protein